MIYIVEGTDGSGKTTMCDALEAITLGARVKANAPTAPALVEYTAPLVAYDGYGIDVVCDRWHVGERVYGPLYRGGCGLSPVAWAAVEGFLEERNACVILCHASVDTCVSRLVERGETPDRDALLREKLAFERALTWTKLDYYMAATDTGSSSQAMAERIVELRKADALLR